MDGNTQAPATLPSLLEQIKDAKSIVEFDAVEAGLAELESKFSGVVYNDIATKDGLARAKADRATVREVRYTVANLASDMKDPLNRLKKLIDGGADRIKARVLKVEEPIDAQIKAEEARIEAEKERKRQEAEALRKARQDKIDAMSNAPTALAGQPAGRIAEALAEVQALEITLDEFGDQAGQAMSAQARAIGALAAMHNAALAAEAQAAELAKLRAEAEERRKREEAEAAGRAAKEAAEAREREAKAQADREAAAAKAAAEQKALATENARQAAELAELRARLEAMKPKPEAAPTAPLEVPGWADATRNAVLRQEPVSADLEKVANMLAGTADNSDADPGDEAKESPEFFGGPTRSEIVEVLADHFDVSFNTAMSWLVAEFGGAK
jgi:chromosome segregation ATPase